MSLLPVPYRTPAELVHLVGRVVVVRWTNATSPRPTHTEIMGTLIGASVEPDHNVQGQLTVYLTAAGGTFAARVVKVPERATIHVYHHPVDNA